MNCLKTIILLVLLCLFTNAKAQLSTNEKPVSFNTKLALTVKSKSAVPIVTTPPLNMAKIEQEDKEDEEYDMPPRFGYSHKVNYNLNNSGTWYELPNGDKLWQLNVVCPNALSVNFCFDKFRIPEGGKLFVYSKDKKHSIGAFTNKNNKGDSINIGGFATGLVYGNNVILEYYHPKEASSDAIISIEYIVHGYRYINIGTKNFGDAGDCMVNVNCVEGQDWQDEKKAIALFIVAGERWCTGSLINTTDLSQEPYLLTANHCISTYGGAPETLTYINFYWNYEAPGCDNTSVVPDSLCTHGASIVANNNTSDFALLRLTEDPINLPTYTPYYLGWDCSGLSGDPGVCIHHPRGDVKKISTVASQPISTLFEGYTESTVGNYWKVTWKLTQTNHGTTENGSSGSPLLNASHKIIGQLSAGDSNCNCDSINNPDWYGKFSTSWSGDSYSYRRLSYWLDPLNSGVQTMEGLLIVPSTKTLNTNQQLYSNIRITSTGQLTIQSDIELMGNSRLIVESGGKLIINGGTLSNVDIVLKPGASLQIVNGGIIETRNGFEAPIGATVDVLNGQIL